MVEDAFDPSLLLYSILFANIYSESPTCISTKWRSFYGMDSRSLSQDLALVGVVFNWLVKEGSLSSSEGVESRSAGLLSI